MLHPYHSKQNERSSLRLLAWPLVLTMALTGCSEQKPPEVPQAVAPPAATSTARLRKHAALADDDTRGSIHVDEEIARLCDLPTAHFAFDSAGIEGDAARVLDKLASCLGQGALEGRSLKIVGHADPRGPIDYNFGLGQRRAGSVAEYLTTRGIADARLTTSSLGELEASGQDEGGWALDRKVEILLADEAVVLEESPYSQLELEEE